MEFSEAIRNKRDVLKLGQCTPSELRDIPRGNYLDLC